MGEIPARQWRRARVREAAADEGAGRGHGGQIESESRDFGSALRKGIPGITAGDAARTLRERCAGEKNLPVGPGGQRVRRGAGRAELGARRRQAAGRAVRSWTRGGRRWAAVRSRPGWSGPGRVWAVRREG